LDVIPALVGFIEGIIYLTMSDEDFEKKYSWKSSDGIGETRLCLGAGKPG